MSKMLFGVCSVLCFIGLLCGCDFQRNQSDIDNDDMQGWQISEYVLQDTETQDKYLLEYGNSQDDGSISYSLSMCDEYRKVIQAFSGQVSLVSELPQIIDINNDGCVDIVFSQPGAMNTEHILYVWDNTSHQYECVETESEMISYFEIYEGYIKNWITESASSGTFQILIWDGNNLVIESEEYYQLEE